MSAAAAVFDPRVEAALLARYGVDSHTCTLRRVHVLVEALPPGYWPDPDSGMAWSTEAHLLAGVVDAVNQTSWMVAAVNSKRPPKRPKTVPRPGGQQRRRGMSVQELAGVLGGGDVSG